MTTDERRARLAASLNELHAYQDIQNEMGRVVIAFNYRQPDRILRRFALDLPDVSLEYADEGVFTGRKAVETIVNEVVGREAVAGEMFDLQLTTPVIEVAGDGESAQALWWCPGVAAAVREDGEREALWLWGMLTADFVRTDEGWLIRHLHYFRYIKCSYDKGWVEDTSMIHRPNTPMHPLSTPSTYHNPYSPTSVRDGLPAAPRPYDTYTGPEWMLNLDKTR